jgi:hypothetical protein
LLDAFPFDRSSDLPRNTQRTLVDRRVVMLCPAVAQPASPNRFSTQAMMAARWGSAIW